MRSIQILAALVFFAVAGEASAGDEHPYSATIHSGVGYSFPNNEFGIPMVDQSSIDTAFTLGAKYGNWNASASYLETDDNDEGYSVGIGYSRDDCLLSIDCEAGISYRDVGDGNTTTYSLGVANEIAFLQRGGFKPSWNVGASATTGDASESSVSVGLSLPYTFGGDLRNWSVGADVNAVHGFESGETLPDWGVSIGYTFNEHAEISFGYESQVSINPDVEDDLDVDRAAFVELTFHFGG